VGDRSELTRSPRTISDQICGDDLDSTLLIRHPGRMRRSPPSVGCELPQFLPPLVGHDSNREGNE